ncbi:MAG: DUF4270 family protein, partial [Bacteroidetes bacterium]
MSACTDDVKEIGKEILSPDDIIGMYFTDTIPITFQTVWFDTVPTYRASLQLFGNMIDPEFGRLTAETFTQVLARSSLNFGEASNLRYDSLVLKLNIESTYGRPATPQTL